ncbi:type VI secretion system membrane subunit TssM [Rhodosalinus sp.]|uniref:type VI secretion system membrane subunit TssM n=2 Tax=Rhodosalinus sp. TaxID=2047741 RepID=UPI003979D3E1
MRRVLSALGSGIGIVVIVTLILSLCLWIFGPLLGFGDARPFESVVGRLAGLAVMWIVALLAVLGLLLSGRKRDAQMAEDIVNAPAGPAAAGNEDDGAVASELSEMREKLRRALASLRRSRLGRRHLYELPWYVLIGPPGAGKTTAIVNSGLQFPLAEEMGKSAVGGVGGTRNCDWWFTDGAVLVDTAGRYSTQDSDARADNAAWLGFLRLLKKHRPRQPINGAIIAISLSDLSMQDEITQKAHADALRRRLQELRETLGVRFPVYVLFTKADLIAGFSETFEKLGKEERAQVWGFTLPLVDGGRGESSPIAGFEEEFGLLLERLNRQALDRMEGESDPQRRSLIAGFPQQVASLRGLARDFLSQLFRENRYEHRQMLRGVYFTSGTQEGTPIDRLMLGMARSFGIGRQAIGTGQGAGRSYFLTRLLDGVIFREAGLVSADDRAERRYRWIKRGAIAATVLLAVAVGTLWTRSYLGNRALAQASEGQIASYQQAVAQIPSNPVADSDLPLVVEPLNTLRDLARAPVVTAGLDPSALGWGLSQEGVIANEARLAYRAALNQHFLPRLLLRLEEQMQSNVNDPEVLFETLKVYLMLGQAGPLDADLIREWSAVDAQLAYPGPNRAALREDIAGHLDALLSAPMERIDLNKDMVDHVRGVLAQTQPSQRVYNGILSSPAARDLPEWRITDIGGPAVTRAMVRSSGKPLTEGIEGIFTYEGFRDVFLKEALGVAQRIQRDSWVIGPGNELAQDEQALMAISRDVLDLYYNDYVKRYDQLLGDLDIVPLESLSHAVEVTNILSGPTSPIVNVLEAVARETRLTAEPEAQVPGGDAAEAAGGTIADSGQATSQFSPRARLFMEAMSAGAAARGEEAEQPGAYVEQRFEWLHRLVAKQEGAPSQLEEMVGTLTEVYQQLNRMSFADGTASGTDEELTALARFRAASARLPGPMERWSKQISVGSAGIAADGTRAGINSAWQSQVLPLCERVVGNSYPFNPRASADASIKDFSTLFAPDGLIDSFYRDNLAKYVDTSTRPWSWKAVGGTDLGISQAVLTEIQRAAEIRDAFFSAGTAPQISFQLTPEALDPQARSVALEIDGQTAGFSHSDGQPRPAAITWPGTVGLARITFEPPASNSESTLSRDGPWGLFRLLDAAEVRNTNVSDRKRLIFRVGGRIAIFQLQSGSVINPFSLPALTSFSCPKTF